MPEPLEGTTPEHVLRGQARAWRASAARHRENADSLEKNVLHSRRLATELDADAQALDDAADRLLKGKG